MENIMQFTPVVFAVGGNYLIMVKVTCQTLMWVKIGKKNYYDDSNGILKSDTDIHKITVPAKELDAARRYTVCFRKIIERKPYFTRTEDICEADFEFKPVSGERIRAYHIADAHGMSEQPVKAARAFAEENGGIDFLILNGDIPDHCGELANIDNIYRIAEELTAGAVPIVFSRGNHDMRGVYAEKLENYTPTENGRSYFTFRLGSIWGLVLDCGEDKADAHEEYGNTICCHAFRKRQTGYIRSVIENAEYLDGGIDCKVVVVHNPFMHERVAPFDIERETYNEWTELLSGYIKPDIMLCGHEHRLSVENAGESGISCPVVVGARPEYGKSFTGAGVVFEKSSFEVTFTDSDSGILSRHTINRLPLEYSENL